MEFKSIILLLFLFLLTIINSNKIYSQCSSCSAAFSGSQLAAGTSNVGVLKEGTFRFITLYRYLYGSEFYLGSETLEKHYGQELDVHLLGFNLAYGINKKFTIDLELSAFPDKNLNFGYSQDRISGFNSASLIGKYTIFSHKASSQELTLGAGPKLKLTNNRILSGNNGVIAQLFYFINIYDDINIVLFNRSEFYIEDKDQFKSGNNISTSLFLTKELFEKFNAILESRYEVQGISYQNDSEMLNTGKQILSLVPQFSYNFDELSISLFFEMPVYKKYEGVQLSEKLATGIALIYMF